MHLHRLLKISKLSQQHSGMRFLSTGRVAGSGEHSHNYQAGRLKRTSHSPSFIGLSCCLKLQQGKPAHSSCFYAQQLNDEVIKLWATLGIYFLKKKKKTTHGWLAPFLKSSLYYLQPPDTRNLKRKRQELQSSTLSSLNILRFQSNYHCALPISYAMFIPGLLQTQKCLGNQLRR